MANRRLTWELPPTTARQAPIKHVEISFRADPSFPWTKQTDVLASEAQELLFTDVAPGAMYYRAIIVDTEGGRGEPSEISTAAPYEKPGTVLNFKATDE